MENKLWLLVIVVLAAALIFAGCNKRAERRHAEAAREFNELLATIAAGGTRSETDPTQSYETGPAGGIVFYDKGDYDGGWRYLEAAPEGNDLRALWGAYEVDVTGTETGIGTGKRNTEIILEYLKETGETGMAAQLCDELTVNGFSDWFLPSLDELNLIYENLFLRNIGGFLDGTYWSSSQNDNNDEIKDMYAWGQYFADGRRTRGNLKEATANVRAVRAF